MFEKLRDVFNRPPTAEDDVQADPNVARTRESGGGPGDDGDKATTTGIGTSGDFVGRIAGQDAGDDRESGAEARAWRE
ncbi:MAG: hypothetical protein H0X35_15595 [Pseudonocardiales bacterium]|nr:hypothetical protein [Pseudonocardiales bacterium]